MVEKPINLAVGITLDEKHKKIGILTAHITYKNAYIKNGLHQSLDDFRYNLFFCLVFLTCL